MKVWEMKEKVGDLGRRDSSLERRRPREKEADNKRIFLVRARGRYWPIDTGIAVEATPTR